MSSAVSPTSPRTPGKEPDKPEGSGSRADCGQGEQPAVLGDGTLQRQVLGGDGLHRGGAGQPAVRYSSLGHDLQETGIPEPPLTPDIPRPCSQPSGPLCPTLEHISCRALAMPLAGTLQWKT